VLVHGGVNNTALARMAASQREARAALCSVTVRMWWLRSCCAVAEGADVPLSHTLPDASSRCTPDVCVAAVLRDPLRRVAVLGGRDGMSRSLGSVYGGAVTRFLGGRLRGVESRAIDTPTLQVHSNGIAVSRDGTALLVADERGGSHAIHVFNVLDGARCCVVGAMGRRPLQFYFPNQVYIAPDGFVFVADCCNDRVQVLTPALALWFLIGEGALSGPCGVCANADVVVVSECGVHRISVFARRDGTLLRRFGSFGSGGGELNAPLGMCFCGGDRHIAVADSDNNRVSVFSVTGEFMHHVGVDVLSRPMGVACSDFDELVVADWDSGRVAVFTIDGHLATSLGSDGGFTGVALHGSTIFAFDFHSAKCVVFD
jgi:DNA-binding beta-propeller fold protein YncE